ncbi:MAG: sulfite exporter TauE/SafE family protein [Pseudonocardiaceae bacterium]
MSILTAVGLGLLIGTVLGGLGGAGAILAVPALVYLLGQSAQDATTSSLVIVGLTAIVGAADHARSGHVHWRTGIIFGVAGIAAAFAGTALNRRVDEHVLLLGFSAVMVLAAGGMLIRTPGTVAATVRLPAIGPDLGPTIAFTPHRAQRRGHSRTGLLVRVLLAGLVVGFLTGFFGVGGGFVIVPALVLALGLPMPAAVGTSLAIIAINAAASLAARVGQTHFDWALIIPFAIAAMAGSFAGKNLADRLPNSALNRAFAILLCGVATYIALTSVLLPR